MTSWKDMKCGQEMPSALNEQMSGLQQQFFKPNLNTSCGGGYFPQSASNPANMSTYNTGIVLPTDKYSVMFFKSDGTPIIYAEAEDLDAVQ